MMARLYSSTALRANLRDRILGTHLLSGPASVMLSSYAAGVMKKEMGTDSYEKDPANCDHPRGLRSYGAGGVSVKICDICGFRGVVMPRHSSQAGRLVALTPKATPTSKTPLHMPPDVAKELRPHSSKSSSQSSPPPSAKAPPAALFLATPKLPGPPPMRNRQERLEENYGNWQMQSIRHPVWGDPYGEMNQQGGEVDMHSLEEGSLYSWVEDGMDEF